MQIIREWIKKIYIALEQQSPFIMEVVIQSENMKNV